MQPGRVRSVGVAQVDDVQRFSLEMEAISIENFRRYQLRRKLPGKARFPKRLHEVGCDLLLNSRYHGLRGERFRRGNSIEQELQPEDVIAMGVSDVNGDKILAARPDPIHQLARLLRGQERIDEHGITLATNERHRIGYPRKMLLACGDSLGGTATLFGEKLPFQLGLGHLSASQRCVLNQSLAVRVAVRNPPR